MFDTILWIILIIPILFLANILFQKVKFQYRYNRRVNPVVLSILIASILAIMWSIYQLLVPHNPYQ